LLIPFTRLAVVVAAGSGNPLLASPLRPWGRPWERQDPAVQWRAGAPGFPAPSSRVGDSFWHLLLRVHPLLHPASPAAHLSLPAQRVSAPTVAGNQWLVWTENSYEVLGLSC